METNERSMIELLQCLSCGKVQIPSQAYIDPTFTSQVHTCCNLMCGGTCVRLRIELALFDVDGTLTPRRPSSTAEFKRVLLQGVEARMRELAQVGIPVALASNQGGVRKGLPVEAVRAHMEWVCDTLRSFGCTVHGYKFAVEPGWRKKPEPGMLLEWAAELEVSPANILYVGDSESDRQAAQAAGCQFAWADEFFAVTINGLRDY